MLCGAVDTCVVNGVFCKKLRNFPLLLHDAPGWGEDGELGFLGSDGEVSPVGSLLYDLITERGEDFELARGRDGCSISPPAEIPQGFWPDLPRENQSRSWVLLPPLHPLGQGNGHVLKPSWGCTKQPEEAGRSWDGAPLFPCASGEQIKGTSL